MDIVRFDKWLYETGFSSSVSFHGYTADGWLWVADLLDNDRPAWFKETDGAGIVENIRGWGTTPDQALAKLLTGMKGLFVKKEATGKFSQVPDFG